MEERKFFFRFIGIDIVLKALAPKPLDSFIGANFSFDVAVESAVHPENKLVIEFVKTVIRDGNKPDALATNTIACIFEIANFDEIIKPNENGTYAVPNELELHLKSLSVSTARGVIYSELRGTYLHNAIMPLVDVTSMITTIERNIFDKGEFITDTKR